MIPHVLKRKQIMWLPPSPAKQFGLVHSQASFWATWRGRKVPILRSPLTALRLHITQICINFYGVCPGAWPKKTHEYEVASVHSFTCWFPDYSTDIMKLWWSTIVLIWQRKMTHNIPKFDTREVVQGYWNPRLQVAVATKFIAVALTT
jgi:hypothetical protein